MESIEVTFPNHIPEDMVKLIIEGNISKNTKYKCRVDFVGFEDEENVFNISSSDGPDVFYYIGMTASAIIEKYSN